MNFKAEVIKITRIKFELSEPEWALLASLVTLGREKLNNINDPKDVFAYQLITGVNEALQDDD